MSENKFDILENVTARVIYYTCIAEAKTIPEIAELWDYKTSTYFYQVATKLIIETMEKRSLISYTKGRGGSIESNYSILIDKEKTDSFFKRLNTEVSNDVILQIYDYEVDYKKLDDPMFRKYLVESKKGLGDILTNIIFDEKEQEQFRSLWKEDLFKNTLLTASHIKTLFNNRQNLPQDPWEFLYGLTVQICEDVTDSMDPEMSTGYFLINPFKSIWTTEESYGILNHTLEQAGHLSYLGKTIEDVNEILLKKVKAYPEESEDIGPRPQLGKFIQKMGFESSKWLKYE